jgi:hypothetical protein
VWCCYYYLIVVGGEGREAEGALTNAPCATGGAERLRWMVKRNQLACTLLSEVASTGVASSLNDAQQRPFFMPRSTSRGHVGLL